MTATTCLSCGGDALVPFYGVDGVPVHSCLLVSSREEALAFPRGRIRLARCETCGFVLNTAYDVSHSDYSQQYEETQAFSPHFRLFMDELARDWVERYDLKGKHVVEIGCGKGEFLVAMAEAGIGSGVGIDPGVHPERLTSPAAERLSWVQGFYPADMPDLKADAVVCRHTLEHVAPVADFMRDVRASIGERTDTVVLFELPDTQRVLDEAAYWDVYYEHCSYFFAGSLARLFRSTGFDVLDVRRAYDDQYLLVEARPAVPGMPEGEPLAIEDDLTLVRDGAARFQQRVDATIDAWRRTLREVASRGGTSVIWGSGSKGVAFLSALGEDASLVRAAVDINPYKHQRSMAGTGHVIVSPEDLKELQPELVVAMNAVYGDEIRRELAALGVPTRLEAL